MSGEASVVWDQQAQEVFGQMLAKIPPFLRPVAQDKVLKKAEELAAKTDGRTVKEGQVVQAFFDATPFGFHGPMKTDMESLGIDYTKYGYQK